MDIRRCFAPLWAVFVRRRSTEEDARKIAQRGRTAVLGRVGDAARPMGVSELRGYVRARAALVIHREVGTLLASGPAVSDLVRQQLVEGATRNVVALVVADLAGVWAWRQSYRAAG